MKKSLEKSARSVDEALKAALDELGLDQDDLSFNYEVVQMPKSGFLGIGALPAIVRVSYDDGMPEPAKSEPVKVEEPAKPVRPEAPKAPAEKSEQSKPAPQAEKPARQPKPARSEKPKEKPAAPEKPKEKPADAPASAGQTETEYAEIRSFLTGLMEHLGVEAEIKIGPRDNGGILVSISGSGTGAIIGRRGETLDAIQHLTNYVVNRDSDRRMHISVDAENYRAKREESLTKLAVKMAEKVLKYKRSMALEPMNSYERHVIHTALQNYEGVTTSSTGVEPNRRVVVSYVKPESPKSNKPQSREWA
jgi:spoIIIJ-associated protein